MNCRLCGQPMIHYRLYGYQCRNRDHHQILNHIYSKAFNQNQKSPDESIEQQIAQWRKENFYDN